jgi:DNA invertase Pin-like site-specific DNA recombinase
MLHIIGAMAEFERELIPERLSVGIQAARRRGKRIGKPRAGVDPHKVETMGAVGVPWRAIGEQMGVLVSERSCARTRGFNEGFTCSPKMVVWT